MVMDGTPQTTDKLWPRQSPRDSGKHAFSSNKRRKLDTVWIMLHRLRHQSRGKDTSGEDDDMMVLGMEKCRIAFSDVDKIGTGGLNDVFTIEPGTEDTNKYDRR